MTERPHCRSACAEHRHDCGIAKREGRPRSAAPTCDPYIGAVVYRWSEKSDSYAAIVVATKPLTLQVLSVDPDDDEVARPDDGQWSWPGGAS